MSKKMDQLGKVAKSARGQLNRENEVSLQMHLWSIHMNCCFHLFASTFYIDTCRFVHVHCCLKKRG